MAFFELLGELGWLIAVACNPFLICHSTQGTIMAYIFPLMLFLWAVSDSHSPTIVYAVVGPAVTFGIIAVIGLCAIVFPAAAASELIAPGLGVY